MARLEPSRANDPSFYEKLQESRDERILDDCPKPDTDIPPLPLLYIGFGEFHDAVEIPPDDLLETRLMDEVDQLVNAMCELGYEKGKQINAQVYLRQIFFQDTPREFSYNVGNGSTADGYLLASHGGPLLIIEYKRQIAMAEPQMASHFLRLALRPVEHVFRQWRQPALGLLIRGKVRWFFDRYHQLKHCARDVYIVPWSCHDRQTSPRSSPNTCLPMQRQRTAQ